MIAPPWNPPPEHPELNDGEVHVWLLFTGLPAIRVESLHQMLSGDEQARAGTFFREEDRRRFIVAHAALRMILSRYLHQGPELLVFTSHDHGKPTLAEQSGCAPLSFNLSHSHSQALIAVATNREVGVDIERWRAHVAVEEIADRYFSPREASKLRSVPAWKRTEAFFNCWTRKEAYVKARGDGLGIPLDSFSVSLIPGEPARLLHTDGDQSISNQWSLFNLQIPDYSAALAVAGISSPPQCWQWID